MALPWRDGGGFLPDTRAELAADIVIIAVVVFLFSFFTGLDAQVAYAVGSPSQYFLSSTSSDSERLTLTTKQVDNINFASKNRIGFTSSGDEIGICGGVRNSGEVYDLRVAEGFEETSRTSVTFSCTRPRQVIMHSQPDYSSGLSVEDRSFDGEFQPEYSCIISGEVAASPVTDRVGGLSCWSVSDSGDFTSVPVVLEG